jgi:hypothetical protein
VRLGDRNFGLRRRSDLEPELRRALRLRQAVAAGNLGLTEVSSVFQRLFAGDTACTEYLEKARCSRAKRGGGGSPDLSRTAACHFRAPCLQLGTLHPGSDRRRFCANLRTVGDHSL